MQSRDIEEVIQKALPDYRVYLKKPDYIGECIYISRYDSDKGGDFITAEPLKDFDQSRINKLIKYAKNAWDNRTVNA